MPLNNISIVKQTVGLMIHWSWGTRLQCAVTRLENVRQSNIRTGKKLGFQLPHRHPHQVGITIHWPRLMYQ